MLVETNVLDGKPIYRPNTTDKNVLSILGIQPPDDWAERHNYLRVPILIGRKWSTKYVLDVEHCHKCGKAGEVYNEPYAMTPHYICVECDDILYNFLFCALGDNVDCLMPVMPNDRRYQIVRAIIDAFFCKVG